MKKQKLASIILASVMVISSVLTGCGAQDNKSKTVGEAKKVEQKKQKKDDVKQDKKKVINYYIQDEPYTLDGQKMRYNFVMSVGNMYLEGLTRLGQKEGECVPGVAETWDFDKENNSYLFKLRKNAKWSDGVPVTADDFFFAWRRALDEQVAYSFFMTDFVKGADEYCSFTKKAYISEKDEAFKKLVEQSKKEKDEDKKKQLNSKIAKRIDSMTENEVNEFNSLKNDLWKKIGFSEADGNIKIDLKIACPFFPSIAAFPVYAPINKEFYNKHIDDKVNGYCLEAGGIYANGPWVVKEWKHKDYIKLIKNENYWNKNNINLDEINLKVISDTSTTMNLLKTGKLDGCSIESNYLKEFDDLAVLDKYNLQPITELSDNRVVYFQINHFNNKNTMNENIRKAILYGIDRKGIVEKLAPGNIPALAFIPDGIPGFEKTFREENGEKLFDDNNKEQAKKYLEKGLKELGVKELPALDLLIKANDDNMKKIAQKCQEDLKQIGIKINIVPLPRSEEKNRIDKGDFAIRAAGWGADYLDPMTFLAYFSPTGMNYGNYKNDEYNKLLDLANKETDAQKRMEYMCKAEKVIIGEVGNIPLYYSMSHSLYKKYVTGVVNRGLGANVDFYWADIDMEAKLKAQK